MAERSYSRTPLVRAAVWCLRVVCTARSGRRFVECLAGGKGLTATVVAWLKPTKRIACIRLEKSLTRIVGELRVWAEVLLKLGRAPVAEVAVVRLFLGLVIGAMVPLGASAQTGADSAAKGKVASDVDAILVDQCVSCHGPEQKKGGLDLSRRATALQGGKSGTAIVPGSPDESLLVDKVADGEMPPKGSLAT